jgi:hypothetical protein
VTRAAGVQGEGARHEWRADHWRTLQQTEAGDDGGLVLLVGSSCVAPCSTRLLRLALTRTRRHGQRGTRLSCPIRTVQSLQTITSPRCGGHRPLATSSWAGPLVRFAVRSG